MIKKVTGAKTEKEFIDSSIAQEKYLEYLYSDYVNKLPVLRQVAPGVDDATLTSIQHFLGLNDSKIYLQTVRENLAKGVKANDAYELAEEAVKKSIEARTKKPAPRNSKVIDYLTQFANAYNQ